MKGAGLIRQEPCAPGAMLGLRWDDETKKKIEQCAAANPHLTPAHIAAALGVSRSTVQNLMTRTPEIMDHILVARARGDNAIATKNFSMALKGDSRSVDREMKKRGMIGADFIPVMNVEPKRDYSKLTVEELEQLAEIDAKTRNGSPPESACREIAAPLHPAGVEEY